MEIKLIRSEDITDIFPLLSQLNKNTPHDILLERIKKMPGPNYECVGIYDQEQLIGICGLWYSMRHYSGYSAEPDHVFIDEKYRNQGLGKELFDWISQYCKEKGVEALELNTYTGNRKSHKFYTQEDFEIYGFHFVKIIRNDGIFY